MCGWLDRDNSFGFAWSPGKSTKIFCFHHLAKFINGIPARWTGFSVPSIPNESALPADENNCTPIDRRRMQVYEQARTSAQIVVETTSAERQKHRKARLMSILTEGL